jgi:hypothetical protein
MLAPAFHKAAILIQVSSFQQHPVAQISPRRQRDTRVHQQAVTSLQLNGDSISTRLQAAVLPPLSSPSDNYIITTQPSAPSHAATFGKNRLVSPPSDRRLTGGFNIHQPCRSVNFTDQLLAQQLWYHSKIANPCRHAACLFQGMLVHLPLHWSWNNSYIQRIKLFH